MKSINDVISDNYDKLHRMCRHITPAIDGNDEEDVFVEILMRTIRKYSHQLHREDLCLGKLLQEKAETQGFTGFYRQYRGLRPKFRKMRKKFRYEENRGRQVSSPGVLFFKLPPPFTFTTTLHIVSLMADLVTDCKQSPLRKTYKL